MEQEVAKRLLLASQDAQENECGIWFTPVVGEDGLVTAGGLAAIVQKKSTNTSEYRVHLYHLEAFCKWIARTPMDPYQHKLFTDASMADAWVFRLKDGSPEANVSFGHQLLRSQRTDTEEL